MHALILHDAVAQGARADETDVLEQAAAVEAALARLGHTSSRLACSADLAAAADSIRAANPDLVFNLFESALGTGRLIHLAPALLESLGVAFTGAGADATYLTSNKLLSKRLMRSHGIPTPTWLTIDDVLRTPPVDPGRYIVKSVWEHASVGLDEDSVLDVQHWRDLHRGLTARSAALGGDGFAEKFIAGREFNLALLAAPGGDSPVHPLPQVLPPAEILFEGYGPDKPTVVGYRAKWASDSYEYHHTPRRFEFPASDAPLLDEVTHIAQRCWSLFNLRGYARVDFRIDETGRPWVLEVNTNPCLSPEAGYAAALAQAGLTIDDAVARILADGHPKRTIAIGAPPVS